MQDVVKLQIRPGDVLIVWHRLGAPPAEITMLAEELRLITGRVQRDTGVYVPWMILPDGYEIGVATLTDARQAHHTGAPA